MSSVALTRTLAATVVVVAVAVVLFARERQPSGAPAPETNAQRPAPAEIVARPALATSGGRAADAATARLRELEAMSETFRNTTFLIAIRDAGFVCNELLGVYGGVNDSLTWTTSCSEMLAYTVRVASNGALGIEPVLGHIDGLPFSPIRAPGGEVVLPPFLPTPPPR